MSYLDYAVFFLYLFVILGVGLWFYRKNKDREDYFVGGRTMKPHHVGLSIVATDVGGGFSIGLGGVGFTMGLSGSWLLFTGLVGAWMSAVFIIPRIKTVEKNHKLMTYPDFLRWRYGPKVALVAAIISGIGYLGFTSGQLLAGAKLASATLFSNLPAHWNAVTVSLLVIGLITIVYTVFGGLKAVIYTDTVQWIILLAGLILVTIPMTLYKIGGITPLLEKLPEGHFSLTHIDGVTFVNWMVTIIPIWLIGMTLYQRMFACGSEKDAKKAWYIAGFFEYPVMAFSGVLLGMFGRYFYIDVDPEMALPMLIKNILPMGITGIVIAAYFSAIMSTADSCLMASSGNVVNDVYERHISRKESSLKTSMLVTAIIGSLAVLLAMQFQSVLQTILYAYSFMVSGLFIPTLGAYFWKRGTSLGAMLGMLGGGGLTILLLMDILVLPEWLAKMGFDASLYGIVASGILFIAGSLFHPKQEAVQTFE